MYKNLKIKTKKYKQKKCVQIILEIIYNFDKLAYLREKDFMISIKLLYFLISSRK